MKTIRFSALAAGILCLLALPISASAQDLLVNGSFEEPALEANTWNVFASIPGWTTSFGCGIEIQNHVAGSPDTGSQHVELDSDCSSGMYQDVATIPGFTYSLSFAFSARPGVFDNHLIVSWSGNMVADLTADGSGNGDTAWQYFTYPLVATASTTRLQFDDASSDDSLGTYVDSATLVVDPFASVSSLCPCSSTWKNHGEFMTCVVDATKTLKDGGYITGAQSGGLRSMAAQSSCGK